MGVPPSDWLTWDPLDRSLIVTHLQNEAAKCPGCGAYTDESTKGDHVYRIHELRCHECNARDKYARQRDGKPGTYLIAEPVPIADLKRN